MTPSPTTTRAAALGLAILVLAGCAGGQPRSRASAATAAACRSRADAVYEKQNRAEVYRSDNYAGGQRDAPFGSVGLPGITSAGLSGRYQRDTLETDCLNSSAGNVGDSGDERQPLPALPSVKTPRP